MRPYRRTSDGKRLIDRGSGPIVPSTRVTRSSALARFAWAPEPVPNKAALHDIETRETKAEIRDIEDVFIPKRRRVAVVKSENSSPNDIKTEAVKSELTEETLDSIPSPPRKAARRDRKPARKTVDRSTGEIKVEPPSDWETMYNIVRKMRAPGGPAYGAAVDTMGCERLADPNASPKDQRFHSLVALMLSSQTKDTVTAVVMKKMQSELPAYKSGAPVGLNLDNMLAVEPALLNQFIWAVGFHNNKTKYLKQTAEILRDKWNGDIPDTITGLTSLPGVGPKMAYLCMSVAWNRTEGIGVDVHVHRITNLWGWNKTKNPEETRLALQSWLPQDRWREINSLLVGLGQAVCLPVGRKCGECYLGQDGLCKAVDRKKVSDAKKLKAEKVEVKDEDNKAAVKLEVTQEVKIKREE